MHLKTLPFFHGTPKKKVTIFTFDISPRSDLCTGGADGEIHIYKLDEISQPPQVLKKHTGAVLSVRFDPTGIFLATASDDKTVVIYKTDNSGNYQYLLRLSDHTSDVSCIAFSKSVFISAGYDKTINIYNIPDYKLRKSLKRNSRFKGVITNQLRSVFCVQSETSLEILNFDGDTLYTNEVNFSGLNMEGFFSRMSYSPDWKYLLAGLSFNEKQACVGIFNDTLDMKYSLMGHVGPSEAVAFHPFKNYVMAVGSQDRSISFWLSEKDTPFLLLKNVVSSPIMDIKWHGNNLVFCSYEGQIKMCCFKQDELGNGKRQNKSHFPLTLKYFELGKVDFEESSSDPGESEKSANEVKDIHGILLPENKKVTKEVAKDVQLITEKTPTTEKMEDLQNKKIDMVKREEKIVNGKKRIAPRLIQENKNLEEDFSPIPPFIKTVGDVTINYTLNKLVVMRKNVHFFTIDGVVIKQICISKHYLCIYYAKSLKVIDICTNTLILPIVYICTPLFKIDLMGHNLMIQDASMNLKVIDLQLRQTVVDLVVPFRDVTFNKKYFLVSFNGDGKFFFERKTNLWYMLDESVDSIYSKDVNLSSVDCTFEKIFYSFTVAFEVKDIKGMRKAGRKLFILIQKQMDDEREEKVRWVANKMVSVGCKNVVRIWLAKMCRNNEMHCLIYDINRLIRDLEIKFGY